LNQLNLILIHQIFEAMEKIRTCDERCHNAKGKHCECWCNGRYHGIGNKKANELYFEDYLGVNIIRDNVLKEPCNQDTRTVSCF